VLWLGEARSNLAEDLIALGRLGEADTLLATAVSELGKLAFYAVRPSRSARRRQYSSNMR
jgi:hypothetical protein